jgi:hypothetical protein
MTTARMALDQVAQRIAQQEAELKSLQKEYRVRTRRLDQLNRRKRQLQAQLDQIEGRIQALNGAETAPPATAKAAALPDQPRKNVRRRSAKKKKAGSLAQFLLTVLREAGKPLSNQELTEEVRRRKFPTQAGDLPKLVATRVWALVKKAPGGFANCKSQVFNESRGQTNADEALEKPPGAAVAAGGPDADSAKE